MILFEVKNEVFYHQGTWRLLFIAPKDFQKLMGGLISTISYQRRMGASGCSHPPFGKCTHPPFGMELDWLLHRLL